IIAGNKSRFWGINRFYQLIKLLQDYNVNILIITTPSEIKTAYDISQGKIPIYYSNKFTRISALVSKLSFLFTPDTSIVHLASIYKIPVFGLYVKYKTNDIIWYSYKSEHEEYITEEENFNNLNFELIEPKFKNFFEKIINGK
nr:glycosyltransferase family 9 protein [Melioribacteraceae bacterium]